MVMDVDAFNKRYQTHLTNVTTPCWTGDYSFAENRPMPFSALPGRDATLLNRAVKQSPDLAVAYAASVGFASGEKPCSHPDDYLFWDKVHPSAVSHMIFSEIMSDYIAQNYSRG